MSCTKKSPNKPNEIHLTRIYDAPVKLVWEAWADPVQAAQWWGPRGYTITHHSKELRAGGSWCYTMHGPDGVNFENETKYLEVEKYSRLVYDHGGSPGTPPLFRVTVNFTEVKGKTKMEMTMALPTAEAAEMTRKRIKQANGNSTWDRLAEFVAKETSHEEKFFINRTFNAPINTMFEVWSNPDHFSKWLPPTGFTMKFLRADLKEGGTAFYVMTSADGNMKMYGRTSYLTISKAENKIVYTQQFCDENEKITHHPMSPTWPETMLTTVTLHEEGPDQTRVTIEWAPYANPTAEEIRTFVQARAGMTQGWTGSFEKLESYLQSISR